MKGCSNGCRYCYAFKMALRFKRVSEYDQWINEETTTPADIPKNKRVMFPSSHDITSNSLEKCIESIRLLLSRNNTLLIVSKPRFVCIEKICKEFIDFSNQIEFRFTITGLDEVDKFIKDCWEPFAPNISERIATLKMAYRCGFKTSVSMEPYLVNPNEIIPKVIDYVTETIWIGIMNTTNLNYVNYLPSRSYQS